MDESALHEKEKQILINLPDQSIIYVRCHYPLIYEHILDYVNDEVKNYSYKHKLCYFLNDLKTFPKCKICGKLCKRPIDYMRSTFKETQLYCCSKQCIYKYSTQKSKETSLRKYGVTNISYLKEIQEKKNKTCLEHYGVTNPSKDKSIQNKKIETNIDRYGVSNAMKNESIKQKLKDSIIQKYGVDNPMHSQEFVDKLKQRNLEKFGSEWFLGTDECLRKTKETVIRKYGVEYITQTKEIRQKFSEFQKSRHIQDRLNDIISMFESLDHVNNINLNCFRTLNKLDHYLQICNNDELKERILIQIKRYQDKLLQEYGTLDLTEDLIKQKNLENSYSKKIETNLQKYGVKDYNQTQECKDKIIKTCIEKFGTKYYVQSEEHRKIMHIKNMQNRYKYFCNNEFVEPQFTFDYYIDGHEDDCLKWKCKKCGEIFEDYRNQYFHWIGRCTKCFPKSSNISHMEKSIVDYLRSIGISNIIENSKKFIKHYELDIICPDNNVCIEFDGVHWHTTEFILDSKYHLRKTELCEQKNFQLIHIFENEWKNKNEIVKSRLNSIFNKNQNIIYARKCQIKEIDYDTSKDFLNKNHLQGNVTSSVNIGLFYNDKLVSLMNFGPYRKALGRNKVENEYELLRFCNILNTRVIGGASKLLKYFELKYNPSKLISYADRRWSKGNMYYKLGFNFVYNTPVNYYYNIKDELENRFIWRKSELSNKLKIFDDNLSEEENMKNNGYYRIYDCGSMLFEKIYENKSVI